MAEGGSAAHRDFGPKGAGADLPPLLLHFDVNKSIIISDMIMNKADEYSIREVIANQFWGYLDHVRDVDGVPAEQPSWIWLGKGRSIDPPIDLFGGDEETTPIEPISYLRFCRKKIKDPHLAKLATRSFDMAGNALCKKQMMDLSDQICDQMRVPPKHQCEELKQNCGLTGEWRLIFPSFFRFIAYLQWSGRKFCVFFRSFGQDLPRIKVEWNAFCNMTHPLYNYFLEGVGPMNGTVEGVPDRRLGDEDVNTMYRDSEGACLALRAMLNGNYEGEWDQWARTKSGEDTREGRSYLQDSGIDVLYGYARIKAWCKRQLDAGRSQLVRDDWAWWHRNGDAATAGKLLIGIEGVQQVFFDDNIDLEQLRIVDPRSSKTFEPVPHALTVQKVCLRVDPLLAMLREDYFLATFNSAGNHLEALDYVSGTYIAGELEESPKAMLRTRGDSLQNLIESLEDDVQENKDAIEVGDVDDLCDILKNASVDVARFGAPGTTYKTVQTLHLELSEGKCYLKRSSQDDDNASDKSGGSSSEPLHQYPLLRVLEVVRVKLLCNNLILMETHQQMPDGRLRSRNGFLPGTKKAKGETLEQALTRWSVEELQIKLTDQQKKEAVASCEEKYEVNPDSMSYPIPCSTHYLEVECRLQPETMEPVLLNMLGLPSGGMFSTDFVKKKKGQATKKAGSRSYWSWYNVEVWEAMQYNEEVELPNLEQGMAILFEGHERRKGYQQLLMQMFDSFSASKLCGGMSGSLVLQVQPVDPIDGKNQEPLIVKLDKAQVVSREIVFSKRVSEVLPDRAARIIGDGCFVTDDKNEEYGAFKLELAGGCWQVPELAGSAQTKDLLSTFKDLFVINSERQLLNEDLPLINQHLFSVHGDVEAVLRELLGPGGMLRVLRREGLARNTVNLYNSFTRSGKDTKWNPLFKPGHFQRAPMEAMWRRTFGKEGTTDLPDVRQQVIELSAEFEKIQTQEQPMGRYCPVVGLAHGDLNAMNVLIDVMDAVWLIDFAFSEEKPVCWDLAKLEIAFMFEYAVLPVCWRTLLAFAGETEEDWKDRKVHTWLKTCPGTAIALLKELKKMRDNPPTKPAPQRKFEKMSSTSSMTNGTPRRRKSQAWGTEEAYDELGTAIERACNRTWPDPLDKSSQKKKDTELLRLHAVLLSSEKEEENAMDCARLITDCMLSGDSLSSVLEPPDLPEEAKVSEGASLTWCWAKCSRLRLFLKEEWEGLQKRVSRELEGLLQGDESPLVFWLGLLQESHRLLGYFDVAPWVKVWACFYLDRLVQQLWAYRSPPGALEPIQWKSQARHDFQKKNFEYRRFPDSFELRLRGSCLNGVERRRWVDKAAARQIRKAHRDTDAVKDKGGLFARVLEVRKVRVGRRELSFRTVDYDLEAAGDALPFGLDGFPKLGVVLVKDDFDRALVKLNTTVVPLPAEAVGRDANRVEIIRATAEIEIPNADPITLVLTVSEDAVFCYPPGTRLRLSADPQQFRRNGFVQETSSAVTPVGPGGRLRHATVMELNEESVKYKIRWDGASREDCGLGDADEVNPVEENHLVTTNFQHQEGTRLICYRDPDRFVSVSVLQLRKLQTESAFHLVREEATNKQDWWIELNDFNHALQGEISTVEYEAEMQRYKSSRKAKHLLIWTVTSERADCLEGPVPRVADSMNDELSFLTEVQALISETDERLGTQTLLKGLLILGQPGSGKSCVLCKIVMQCLSRSKMLIPLLIPVPELVNRLSKTEANVARGIVVPGSCNPFRDGESLIDTYLRSCFGDDTQRYFMLAQALQSHRLLLLFDGLDEAGRYLGRVERCLTALVAQDHRVIVTARMEAMYEMNLPRSPRQPKSLKKEYLSPSWLKTAPDLFKTVELLPFNSKDRKCMVEVLLRKEVLLTSEETEKCEVFVEEFIDMLEEDERRKWNTPLMVAMLVASWREKRRQDIPGNKEEAENSWGRRAVRRSTTTGGASPTEATKGRDKDKDKDKTDTPRDTQVDIANIYTVALDLLLRRFQSRLQADRHKMKDTVEQFKKLLEVIATKLTRDRIKVFSEADVLPLLEENNIATEVWENLDTSIRAGRVPLLLHETDEEEGTKRFWFAYGSFQRFLTRREDRGRGNANADSVMRDFSKDSAEVKAERKEKKSSGLLNTREESPAWSPKEPPSWQGNAYIQPNGGNVSMNGFSHMLSLPLAEDKPLVSSPRMPALPTADALLRTRRSDCNSEVLPVFSENLPPVSPRLRFQAEPLAALRCEARLERKSEVNGELLDLRDILEGIQMEMPPLPSELKARCEPRNSFINPLPPPPVTITSSRQQPRY